MACRGKKEEYNAALTHRAHNKENRKAQGNVMAERKISRGTERGIWRGEDGCHGHNKEESDDGS